MEPRKHEEKAVPAVETLLLLRNLLLLFLIVSNRPGSRPDSSSLVLNDDLKRANTVESMSKEPRREAGKEVRMCICGRGVVVCARV